MAEETKSFRGILYGRAFYTFNRKPQFDKENKKYTYKIDLVLTDADGKPYVVPNKKTGELVNMVERAKEYNIIVKEPKGDKTLIDGTYVRIKRDVKTRDDGSVTSAPETVNGSGEEFDKIIGNESLVQVEFSCIPIKQGSAKGKNMAYLNKIVVRSHVPYVSTMDEFEFATDAKEEKASSNPQAPFDDEDFDLAD